MTIESATYINGLNASYPGASDARTEGDDHLRLIKSTVKATFPNVSGAVTPTHTVINNLAAGTFPTVSVTGVVNLTTIGGIASFVRSSGEVWQRIDIDTTTADGHVFNGYSRATNAKSLIFNSTTDASDTAPSAGNLGFDFQVLSASTASVDGNGVWTFVTCPRFNLPSSQTLTVNRDMAFALTSNTNLRIYVRGSDGTTRTANITLS